MLDKIADYCPENLKRKEIGMIMVPKQPREGGEASSLELLVKELQMEFQVQGNIIKKEGEG